MFYWCLVHDYSKVVALKDDELDYIYFEAFPKPNSNAEYVLPVDERDSKFNLATIEKLAARLNRPNNESLINK